MQARLLKAGRRFPLGRLTWMRSRKLACNGEEPEAYARLLELEHIRPGCRQVHVRLYWLLKLRPDLDRERSSRDWLTAGLAVARLTGPLKELYRREIVADPAEATRLATIGCWVARSTNQVCSPICISGDFRPPLGWLIGAPSKRICRAYASSSRSTNQPCGFATSPRPWTFWHGKPANMRLRWSSIAWRRLKAQPI